MVSVGSVRIWAGRARGNLSAYLSNSLGTQKQFNNEAFSKTNKQQKKEAEKKKKPCACFSSNRNHMGIYWEDGSWWHSVITVFIIQLRRGVIYDSCLESQIDTEINVLATTEFISSM